MTTRAGFVALIGEPNAGKSTLLNRMVGAKVSIVTHKVQTTRARIRGVAMEGERGQGRTVYSHQYTVFFFLYQNKKATTAELAMR